jgi:hypothetical protein
VSLHFIVDIQQVNGQVRADHAFPKLSLPSVHSAVRAWMHGAGGLCRSVDGRTGQGVEWHTGQ